MSGGDENKYKLNRLGSANKKVVKFKKVKNFQKSHWPGPPRKEVVIDV